MGLIEDITAALLNGSSDLSAKVKSDIELITTYPGGWSKEINLISPDGTTLLIRGLHSKHHLGLDTDGLRVNSKNAHISFSEKFLTDNNYPLRNLAGEVNLKNHRVEVADSTGIVKSYVIKEWYPDETVGLIVCMLGDFKL